MNFKRILCLFLPHKVTLVDQAGIIKKFQCKNCTHFFTDNDNIFRMRVSWTANFEDLLQEGKKLLTYIEETKQKRWLDREKAK